MSSLLKPKFALCCLVLAIGSGCATEKQTARKENPASPKTYALPESLRAEAQCRPGVDETKYPLIEIYLSNQTAQQVEWKRVYLNGAEIQPMTNGVIWFQFYPTQVARPGQTVLLQICEELWPSTEQNIEAETTSGARAKVTILPFALPRGRVAATTWSWDFRRLFVAYTLSGIPMTDKTKLIPSKVLIDDIDVVQRMRVMEIPTRDTLGMVSIDLPSPPRQGQTSHVRIEFPNSIVSQCILRAHKGIFLDAFGVDEKDKKLRRSLGLDLRPTGRLCNYDPACTDSSLGNKIGASATSIITTRKTWYTEGDDRLSYVFLCTSATPNAHYSVYGQCMDAIQVNPYQLGFSQAPNFIEAEENYFRWGRQAAQPRPWYWIPETHEIKQRIMEPQELRLLTYAALGNGVKGINYFCYSYGGTNGVVGFDKSPLLLAEIKKINREIKTLEPILSPAIPVTAESVGSGANAARVYTLWCADQGIVAIVRRLSITTDRLPNSLGNEPRFTMEAMGDKRQKLEIEIRKPSWFTVRPQQRGLAKLKAVDLLTHESVQAWADGDMIKVDIKNLSVVKAVYIPNSVRTKGHL